MLSSSENTAVKNLVTSFLMQLDKPDKKALSVASELLETASILKDGYRETVVSACLVSMSLVLEELRVSAVNAERAAFEAGYRRGNKIALVTEDEVETEYKNYQSLPADPASTPTGA
jgi:hypothetical protein